MTAAESVQVLPERPSQHFAWSEFRCHDQIETEYPLDWRISRGVPLAAELERIRAKVGPFTPTSVYRTWAFHKSIYQRMNPPRTPPVASEHLFGRAADVPCPDGMDFTVFVGAIKEVASASDSKIRYVRCYRRQRFIHLDLRESRKTLLIEYEV